MMDQNTVDTYYTKVTSNSKDKGKLVEYRNTLTGELRVKVYFIGPRPLMWYTRYLASRINLNKR